MKRLVYSSYQFNYDIEVIPEANDEDDNPTCWGLKFQSEDGDNHFVWITKYDENEYVVEDSRGNNIAKHDATYKTFSGAKRSAADIARRQVMRDLFTN